MAKRPTVNLIGSGYASKDLLNNNFEELRDAFDNTLSLDGSTPNAMGADLDMNSNDILNAGSITANALSVDGKDINALAAQAEASAQAAADTLDEFETKYLGAKATDPTVDNDGNPLQAGALYVNTGSNSLLYYDGVAWIAPAQAATRVVAATGDGTTTDYALGTSSVNEQSVFVYVDGVYQNKDGYSISGSTLAFSEAPPLNAAIEVVVFTAVAVGGTLSELVTYNQGGTGAVDTTVQAKLQEFVSVKDFGAVGDGVTDDTAAIQAAINQGGKIYFPSNKTYVSSRIQITNDVELVGYDTKILHKANSAATGVGLLEMKTDNKLVIRGLEFDGNASNQTAAYAYYNLIWCSIGSLQMHDCIVRNTKGHAIRTGNIDDFNAANFAHDVLIENCQIIMDTASNSSGDCIRIERTQGGIFRDNYLYGGLSGLRTQLYCKDLSFFNNDVGYSWADVGITVAMSENLWIIGNNCHHHFSHGIEIDAVVRCQCSDNYLHNNSKAGIWVSEFGASFYANEATYSGSIADGYGTDYSDQTHTSTPVPSIGLVISNNTSVDNYFADNFIGVTKETVYKGNYVNNPNKSASYNGQIYLSGGTINETGLVIVGNTLVASSSDDVFVEMSGYQFDARIENNETIGTVPLATFVTTGMWDANRGNRFLYDTTKRSSLLSDVYDTTSPSKTAVSHTTTGNTSYQFKGVGGSGGGEKMVRFVARVGSGTQTGHVATNLYTSAGAYVATLQGEDSITLTNEYQEFTFRVPNDASNVGQEIWPQLRIPDSGVTLYIAEMNFYFNAGDK